MKFLKSVTALAVAVPMFLFCVYPEYEGDVYQLEEQQSVWQYLSAFSIFRDRLPAKNGGLTPQDMFDIISDTLKGGRYTAYDYSLPPGSVGGPKVEHLFIQKIDGTKTVYVEIPQFTDTVHMEFMARVEYMRQFDNIIIDLRGNGGGLVNFADDVVAEFVKPNTPYLKTRYMNYDGKKLASSELVEFKSTPKNGRPRLSDKKVAILADRNSASASEMLASALKDCAGAHLIGETTYGKGIAQYLFKREVAGRKNLRITFMEISGITGRTGNYHRRGIDPDPVSEDIIDKAKALIDADVKAIARDRVEEDAELIALIAGKEADEQAPDDPEKREIIFAELYAEYYGQAYNYYYESYYPYFYDGNYDFYCAMELLEPGSTAGMMPVETAKTATLKTKLQKPKTRTPVGAYIIRDDVPF